jgi:hypothetical protein
MGVSTDGEISYGIAFPEGFYFPWVEHDDIDDWWLDVSGYKPPFELYDATGNFIGGVRPTSEKISAYYEPRAVFQREHPLPVELVNVCSGNSPIYILALEGTLITANRGYPKAFNPDSLVVTDEQRNTLIEFCKTHNIDTGGVEPGWYLSSYWG